ncbi:MAG: methionyl-tRNA formyltransferase [Patescibacteria group bacterium]
MKLIFFGSGLVALPSLTLLKDSIQLVVSQPDRPSGRQHRLTPTPVSELTKTFGLPLQHSLNDLPEADLGIVIDYGVKIPQAIIDHFPFGIINLHPSLLPRWRGSSPIQSALLSDDAETGVTIMLIDTGLDTGPILSQQNYPISIHDTAITLEKTLSQIGADLLTETIHKYLNQTIRPQAQSTLGVTIAKMLRKSDGELRPDMSARKMWNRYRALQPWPGVYFVENEQRYKITQAHWQEGKFICDMIQPAGKPAMSLADFEHGYKQVLFTNSF